jgi:hypothetical protein
LGYFKLPEALAERQGATIALMMGHRTLGVALMATGAFSESRRHLDQAVALYNAGEHRPSVTRFAVHAEVANLSMRAMVLWQLGFPNATLSDLEHPLKEGREIGHAASLMGALFYASFLDVWCKGHSAERKLTAELLVLAEEKHTPFFAALGTIQRGVVLAVTGDAEAAAPMIDAGMSQYRSMNSTYLTRWINRVAGEIALLSPEIDVAKAERYFEKALAVARQQQAKSWELRAAVSMARLWRDQGKPQQPPYSSWLGFSPRAAAACDVPFQACFGARRSVWHSVARAATSAACPYCGNA